MKVVSEVFNIIGNVQTVVERDKGVGWIILPGEETLVCPRYVGGRKVDLTVLVAVSQVALTTHLQGRGGGEHHQLSRQPRQPQGE